jgi:Protein of unknown function (DUF2909)
MSPLIMKLIVIGMLLVIVGSLLSALVYLYKDRGGTRMATALTIRVGLSITVFCLLMAGLYFGIIPPQGLR